MKTLRFFVALIIAFTVISLSCSSDSDSDSGSDDDHSDDNMDDDSVMDPDDDSGPCSHDETKGEAWVDMSTNLTWQTGNSCSALTQGSAVKYCENLEIDGIDDWRLATISELRTLIRGCPETMTGGDCSISDDCFNWSLCESESCGGCDFEEGPEKDCYYPAELQGVYACYSYWSSTPTSAGASNWWCVLFATGGIVSCDDGDDEHGISEFVRCVRP
jgi:hypothetical protein